MMPDQLINTAGGTIHVPFIGAAFGSSELGFVSLTFSALYLPVTVLATAIKDVFRQRAAVDHQLTGSCRAIYLRLLLPVTAMGVVGFGLLYWWSPWLFTFMFGSGWAPVGEYARILIPMFFMNFVSMSMGGVLVITRRLGVSLGWQVANLGITLVALTTGIAYFRSIEATLWAFTVAKAVSYGLYMVLSYYYAGKPISDDVPKAAHA
jgi:O-antigen/teichoic acid export membrane protein